MYSFTAIDFETAQATRNSICQIGLVRVEDGLITESISRLVRPPDNYYFYRNVEIHGITPDRTRNSAAFDVAWGEIEHLIRGQTVVAHNGAFDFSCLQKTLSHYQLEEPVYDKQCTYKIYGKKLNVLCAQYGIRLNHHDALSDALACAELYKLHLQMTKHQ